MGLHIFVCVPECPDHNLIVLKASITTFSDTAPFAAVTSTLVARVARTRASPVPDQPLDTRFRPCTRTPTPATIWAAIHLLAPAHRKMVSKKHCILSNISFSIISNVIIHKIACRPVLIESC